MPDYDLQEQGCRIIFRVTPQMFDLAVPAEVLAATTAYDPRAENCKGFKLDANGNVVGIEIRYFEDPTSKYRITNITLIDQIQAGGRQSVKCDVRDKFGGWAGDLPMLAWPYPDAYKALPPGNPNNEHMLYSIFTPPAVGPLGFYVADSTGKRISDWCYGWGLPGGGGGGIHIGGIVSFVERSTSDGGDGGSGGDGGEEPPTSGDALAVMTRVAVALEAFNSHMGVK